MPKLKAGSKASKRRGKHRICGAAKANGEPCLRTAGQGTDHVGVGRCYHHGGKSPTHRAAAGKELSTPVEVTPAQAVEGAMFSAAGEVAYAVAKIAELEEPELFEHGPHPMLRLKWSAEERLVKYAKTASDIGVDTAKLRIQAAQTQLMATFIENVLGKLDLTPEQQAMVGPTIRRELAVVSGQGQEKT